jgi:dTDP-4-dehydrorhamnose reductase
MYRTIWITGAGGLIGNYLVKAAGAQFPGARVVGVTRGMVDLTDATALTRAFQADRPDLVIHCAAMSRSPECQAKPELARAVNVEATRVLAELSAEAGFIFFSTDLVFDGKASWYEETAEVNPLGVYAETKAEAETYVLKNPAHAIVRTSLNSGKSPSGSRSFNEEMLAAWRSGRGLKLFTDEFRCPIDASVTARAVCELAALRTGGIFHLAGAERLSRWEIGQWLAKRFPEVPARMEPGSLKEYVGAPRAPDVSLNCRKIQQRLSFRLPAFSAWLQEHGREWT